MKCKFKPFIFILILSLLVQLISKPSPVYAKATLAVGDYVYFGQYNGQSILWRVINLDELGDPLLFSEQILSYKAFDAAEGSYSPNGEANGDRQIYGSNRWSTSNLREWLNSDYTITSFSSTPPKPDALLDGFNVYEYEPGFLYNFTFPDRDAIKTVIHKTLLSEVDHQQKSGGEEVHAYANTSATIGVTNYDEAYYEMTEEKVFLLSIQELSEFVQEREWSYKKSATQSAKEWDNSRLSWTTENVYWLRTPAAQEQEFVRYIYDNNFCYYSFAYDGSFGVCPALYINKDLVKIESGQGDHAQPYRVVGINESLTFEDANLESSIRQAIDRPSGSIMLTDVLELKELDASGRQIVSIQGIEKLINLETLDLSYNQIKNIDALDDLKKLKQLYLQYNSVDTESIKILTKKGINVVSEEIDGGNLDIQAILDASEGKSTQEIYREIKAAIQQAATVTIPTLNNELTLNKDNLITTAESAMKASRQVEQLLIENKQELNRASRAIINIQAENALSENFKIHIDKSVLELKGVDDIYIQTPGFVVAFSPQKLKEDFAKNTVLTIVMNQGTLSKNITVVAAEDAVTDMGLFAQRINEQAKAYIRKAVAVDEAEVILIRALKNEQTKQVAVLGITYQQDQNPYQQLKSRISVGFKNTTSDILTSVFYENSDLKRSIVGGKYEETNTLWFTTGKSGDFFSANNYQFYADIASLTDEEKTAIEVLTSKGILSEIELGLFEPEKEMTRAEIAKAIVQMTYLIDPDAQCDFKDVSKSNEDYTFIASAKEKGIISGYPDMTFLPEKGINTNELVKICAGILAFKGYIYPINNQEYIDFASSPELPDWTKDYLALAARETILDSLEKGSYEGEKIVTRKSAALMLYKLYQKL